MEDYDFVLKKEGIAGKDILKLYRKNKSRCYCYRNDEDICTSLCVAFQVRESSADKKSVSIFLACMKASLFCEKPDAS